MRYVFFVLFAVVMTACAEEGPAPFAACTIGELTGTWRIRYVKTQGSCGDLNDETVVMSAEPPKLAAACTYAANNIGADKCTLEQDFTCPTLDNQGTQRWVGSYRQTAAGQLTGSVTLQADHPAIGMCRATYDVTWAQQ